MISYHLLLARKHGETEGYPVLVSFGDTRALTDRYTELSNHPGLAEFAKENAEIMLISDGIVLHHHDFDDPKTVEQQRKAKALADARSIATLHQQAAAAAAAAAKQASDARAALKQLTPEQVALLRADDEARAKAEAERKAKEEAERQAAEQERQRREKADAEAKRIAAAAAARDTFITELSGQTDEQLLALAASNKAQVEAGATRDQIIESLLLAAGFEDAPVESK